MQDKQPPKEPTQVVVASTAASEASFFNGVIASRGDFDPFAPRGWKTLALRFEEFVQPKRPLSILDIGCGTGQSRQIYAHHIKTYVGVDLSEQALQIARQRFTNDVFVCADACELPFADGSFDLVAFSSVLHHIPDYTAALREANRVLSPSGFAFAFDPNLLHPAMAMFRWPKSPFYIAAGVSPNERPLMPGWLRNAFHDAGFEGIRQRAQSDIPYREVAPRLINACLGIYNFADRLYDRVGLGRWLGTFVITAGQKR